MYHNIKRKCYLIMAISHANMSFSVLLYVALLIVPFRSAVCNYNISIIHFNDFHARYETINSASGPCHEQNCIGGFSRLYSAAKYLIGSRPNPIFLNAGDNFQGSLWYNVYKWNVTQHFINKLPLDAITLGNHEFDDQIDGLVPFLTHIEAPMVVANIDDSKEPRFEGLYNKSTVIERDGRKIGIVGVVLAATKLTSNTENLILLDESPSVNAEADNLIKSQAVFTNIVLSHCGYERDLEIAKNSSSKISIIVGGHTDTFLYTGEPSPGPDKSAGPYPTVVKNKEGKTVLVVQASAHSKYLGNLTVIYDDFGYPIGWTGNPIFLDGSWPTDKSIDKELEQWKIGVDAKGTEIVGQSLFPMPNKPCRAQECLLGNFITDAIAFSQIDTNMNDSWTHAAIALMHAGGMRESLRRGNISFSDLTTTFPFEDTIDTIEMKGEHLKEILEGHVDDRHLHYPHLLHVSGIQVIFNLSQAEGNRIHSLKVRCRKCDVPHYENLQLQEYYRIALPGFLTNTGFNPLFKKYMKNKVIGERDTDIYVKYFRKRSPIFEEVQGRIIFI